MKRVWIGLVGGAGLGLAAWMSPPSSAAPVPSRPVPAVASRPADVDPLHLARLIRHTEIATAPRLLDRDPFSFDPAPRRHPAFRALRTEAPARVPAAAPTPASPALLPALAGIAQQDEPGGIVRTAVLTDPDGTVRFVVIGQVIDSVYRVSEIGHDRVVFVNARTGGSSQLVLK